MADPPTNPDATGASRPTSGNGSLSQPYDPRYAEIERLRKERDEWRAREHATRAVVDQLHNRLTLLSQASKRFAASMRSGTGERQRYRRRIGAQYAVSRVLAGAHSLTEAAPEIMQILGDRLGWQMGVLWIVRDTALRCESTWRSPTFPPSTFEESCRSASFSRGEGLPGRVWSRSEPVPAQDLLEEDDPLGQAASEAGLRGAIGFPVRDGGLVGVFELFRTDDLVPDDDLLPTLALVGRQIGQFVERRRAETERDRFLLREREARGELSSILESISDAFFAVDREWRFTYVNKRAEELWSRARADLLGKNLWEEFPRAAGSEQYEMIRRAMKERTTMSFEPISPIAGVWVAGRAYPSTNGGVAVYFDDVTERKQAEAELLALKDELDAELSAMVRLHELNTRLFATSELHPVLEEVLDASIKLQGADFGNIQLYDRETGRLNIVAHRGFSQDFLDYFRDADENTSCGRALQHGERIVIEDVEKDAEYEPHRRIAASTGYRAVQSTPLFDRHGEPLGILSTHFGRPHRPSERELRMTDLYARQAAEMIEAKLAEQRLRLSEERLRRAIGIETVGVIFFKGAGQITEANDAFLKMIGYNREDLAQGLLRWDVMTPPEWMPRTLEAVEKLQSTGRTTPYEKEYIRKDGSRGWGLFAATLLGEEDGVEFIIDVTERKRAEMERERLVAHEVTARAQAEERRRLSRELHDRVAHDMALVHQSLELHVALKESDAERAEAKLELAKATAKEALHSTRNLSMELRQPEVRQGLRAALSDLLQDVVPPAVDSRIIVDGDEDRVPPDLRNQRFVIMREAVRNAVAHSGCANIVVGLSISPERVVGYVEDDGRGFDAAEPRWGGGIRSMRERAALAGAKLEISPAPNGGTKVMVSVPLQEG